MFQVFLLPQVEKELKKLLTKKELLELKKFVLGDLSQKGDSVGNQLSYPFLREKKIAAKRVYYLVYKEIAIILIVGSSDKKSQQETINYIKSYLSEFKEYAYKLHQELKEKEDNN
ncbi:MAG: hypothetical protein ACMXYB_05295 [Candidatus Woesearchaeota archaeon]